MSRASHEAAIWAGEEIPDVRRPCGRDGCEGTYVGVLCCEACGALVPFDRRGAHDRFHLEIAVSPGD